MGLLCGYSIRGTTKSKNKKMHVQVKRSKQSIRPMGEGVIMKPPCRGCQFREVGCHSKCESYIQWRAQLDKYNEQKNIQNDASKYIRDNVSTIRHRMRKLKGYSCTVRD